MTRVRILIADICVYRYTVSNAIGHIITYTDIETET